MTARCERMLALAILHVSVSLPVVVAVLLNGKTHVYLAATASLLLLSLTLAHVRALTWLAACCIVLWVGATQWPARLAFNCVRSQYQSLADRAAAGEAVALPFAIGWSRILAVEHQGEMVFLWTDLCPSGRTGVARCSDDHAQSRRYWSSYRLAEGWHVVAED